MEIEDIDFKKISKGNGKIGFEIWKNGKYVKKTGVVYDDQYCVAQGLKPVKKGGKWGFIDENGKAIIDFIYDDVWFFNEDFAPVKKDNYWGYLSISNPNQDVEFKFDEAYPFRDGFAFVCYQSKWLYIDKDGKELTNMS